MVKMICSEERCDIHDVEMVIDNEDNKRPHGRNPWRGMCLRIDALDRINKENLEHTLVDHYSSRSEFEEIPEHTIRMIVQAEIRKQIPPVPNSTLRNVNWYANEKRKSGGTPL